MKRHRVFAFLASTVLFIPVSTIAQVDISSVTARAGVIRTQWNDASPFPDYLWSFYPELEIGGHFMEPYLTWGISWGYWSDGIDRALPVADMVTYSESGHLVAARIGFQPQVLDHHWPVPVKIFAGITGHFMKSKYVGGTDLTGRAGTNSTDQATTAFFGLGLSIPVVPHINLEAEALQFVPFGDRPIDHAQKNRRAFAIGAAVLF
jgi:hypothetical protein